MSHNDDPFKNNSKATGSSLSRRGFLGATGAIALSSGVLSMPYLARASSDSLKLGVLLSFSGGLELFGQQGFQGAQMAVNEVNSAGGVLGRQIEIIKTDDKSDPRTAVERATQLVRRDKANAVIGPITSANRDAIRPTLEKGKTPLLYATDYEGGVCSDWIACYSPVPAHFVNSLIPYLKKTGSENYYLFGADYTWPQKMNVAIRSKIEEQGSTVTGEEYTPFGVKDFAPTIRKIANSGTDVVILTLPGADGITFVKQFHAAGLKDKVRLAFMGFNENYLSGFSGTEAEGIIAPLPFMQTLDRPEAQDFVARQKKAFGDDSVVSYYAESHYGLTRFYLEAIKRADSDEAAKIMAALTGQTMTFGNGEVLLREGDNHVNLNMLIAGVNDNKLNMLEYIGNIVAPNQCSV